MKSRQILSTTVALSLFAVVGCSSPSTEETAPQVRNSSKPTSEPEIDSKPKAENAPETIQFAEPLGVVGVGGSVGIFGLSSSQDGSVIALDRTRLSDPGNPEDVVIVDTGELAISSAISIPKDRSAGSSAITGDGLELLVLTYDDAADEIVDAKLEKYSLNDSELISSIDLPNRSNPVRTISEASVMASFEEQSAVFAVDSLEELGSFDGVSSNWFYPCSDNRAIALVSGDTIRAQLLDLSNFSVGSSWGLPYDTGINEIAFNQDCSLVAGPDGDYFLNLRDLEAEQSIGQIEIVGPFVQYAFHPVGGQLYLAEGYGSTFELRIFDPTDGEQLDTVPLPDPGGAGNYSLSDIEFSGDGSRLFIVLEAGSGDDTGDRILVMDTTQS